MKMFMHVKPGFKEPALFGGRERARDHALEPLICQHPQATTDKVGRWRGAVRDRYQERDRTISSPWPRPGALLTPADSVA